MYPGVRYRTSSGVKDFTVDDAFLSALSVGEENRDLVAIFITSWVALLSDSPLDRNKKPAKTYRRFIDEIAALGLKQTVIRYSNLAHQIVKSSTIYGAGSLTGDWIDDMKTTPVFYEYHRFFQTGDPVLLDYLYTFLNFGKKLDYVDASFSEVAFRDWTGIETKLRSHVYDASDTTALQSILRVLLPRFQIEDFRPKFGPGSVSERGVRGRIGKIQSFQFDPLVERFFFHGYLGRYGMGDEFGLDASKVIPDLDSWSSDNKAERIARLRFVPKNLKVARSICMEPNTLMYFQQGVMREMLRLLGRSSFSRFIDINDQVRNTALARYGSYTGSIDTIDLSAASDSVGLRLVRKIFPASWLIPLLVTRSHSTFAPDGSSIRLEKFAPMGSALCFPTQCIIFTAVCIYAACLYCFEHYSDMAIPFEDWLTDENIRKVVRSFMDEPADDSTNFQPLAVYGDDICVDFRLTPIVTAILDRLGFSVNGDKSFVGSQAFRESCGGFYLNDYDITPVLFRVRGVRRKVTAAHVASQVQLANSLYRAGRFNTASYLRRCLDEWGGGKLPLPYTTDDRYFGHLCREAHNGHLKARMSPDRRAFNGNNYQRLEYRVWTISYDSRESGTDVLSALDNYEYMRWWSNRTSKMSAETDQAVARYDTSGSRIRWRWIPAYQ
jgi:hypothetical protein